MDAPAELNLEQKFELVAFELQVGRMSEAQAKTMLVELHASHVAMKAMYLDLLAKRWGFERQDNHEPFGSREPLLPEHGMLDEETA